MRTTTLTKLPKPYTMAEIDAILDEAERDFKAGKGFASEDVFRELEEEFEKENLQLQAV